MTPVHKKSPLPLAEDVASDLTSQVFIEFIDKSPKKTLTIEDKTFKKYNLFYKVRDQDPDRFMTNQKDLDSYLSMYKEARSSRPHSAKSKVSALSRKTDHKDLYDSEKEHISLAQVDALMSDDFIETRVNY